MYKRFFDKIALSYLIIIAIVFVMIIVYASSAARKDLIEEKETNLANEATYIREEFINPYINGKLPDKALQDNLNKLDTTLDIRIWYLDVNGNLLFASNPPSKEGDTSLYAKLPTNIFKLDNSGIFLNSFSSIGDFYGTFSQQVISYGTPIDGTATSAQGMIILHAPFRQISDLMQNMFISFFVPICFIIILSMVALMILARKILNPLNQLNDAAKQYAAGNFDVKTGITSDDEIGELASNLEYMASELSKLDEYRKSFVANISHDFRSPLTSIKGYIEAMLDGTIPKDNQERYLKIVLSETQRLTKLTTSMLDMNKNDSYGLKLNLTNFNVTEIIDSTSDIFEGTCKERYIVIRKNYQVSTPIVHADKTRIQQVIYNLVDNAIKFSPHGSTITISVKEIDDKILVSVKDTGHGIQKEQQAKIWDRFYKGDTSRGKDKQGSGLGLSIIQEIIRAHGENITLSSTPGQGSEFVFSLKKAEIEGV